jgi:hypothetical protein
MKILMLGTIGTSLGLALARWQAQKDEKDLLSASNLVLGVPTGPSQDPDQQFVPRRKQYPPPSDKFLGLPILRWDQMSRIDPQTLRPQAALETKLRQPVRIPGFVVPLELEDRRTTEFLLVPTAGACYHVPPPPPENMILVTMRNGDLPRREEGPVWVYGLVEFVSNTTNWGRVGYAMHAQGSIPYEGGYDP